MVMVMYTGMQVESHKFIWYKPWHNGWKSTFKMPIMFDTYQYTVLTVKGNFIFTTRHLVL